MADDDIPKWLLDWNELQAALKGERIIPTDDTNQEEPRTEKDSGPREHSERQSIPDALAAINRTLADQGDADRSEERREDKGSKWLQGLTLFFVVLTTIGIFWQGSIFNKQLTEMKSAGEQTKQLIETNAKLAEIASQQAAAAVDQAKATDKEATAMGQNAQVAHDNMIASERAWVGPRNASIDGAIQVGKDLGIVLDYTNTGKEPANNFVPTVDGFTETTEEDTGGKTVQRIFEYFQKCQASAPSIVAGQVVFPSTGFSNYNLSTKVPASAIDQDFVDGKKTLIVQGCFLYASFEIIRHTYFCYFFKNNVTKPSNLSICMVGHYAD